MPEIPEQLKWYTPLKLGVGSGLLTWRISVDDWTGCIEIKRASFVRISTVLLSLLPCAFISWCLFGMYTSEELIDEARPFIFVAMILSPLFIVLAFVALDNFCSMADSRYWNEPLRFRFDPQRGELFFPRENITYRAGDYANLVVGCVRGSDMRGLIKRFGAWWDINKQRRLRIQTQIFMLVFDKNDQWRRYTLSSDDMWVAWITPESGSKQFLQLADLLQQHLSFETFVKDYSLDECYEQQR